MAVLGADVDALDALARRFDQESRQLVGSMTAIEVVMRSAWWSGANATRFERDWHTQHAAAVRSVAHLLTDASRGLAAQSKQQRTTSNDTEFMAFMFGGTGLGAGLLGGETGAASPVLTRAGQLETILSAEGDAADAARKSVVNAAKTLAKSGNAEERSAAGYILAKYGGTTKFVDTPYFKAGSRGMATIGFFFDVAKYSSEHKAVVEVVSRSALNTAGAVAGAELGAEGGAAIGTAIAPGPGTVIGGVIGAVVGGVAGHEAADIVGGIAFGEYRLVLPH